MSSSSEDEINDALKESANCDYIKRLVDPANPPVATSKPPERYSSKNQTENGTNKESEFETFLARRLASRLDERIKIVEKSGEIVEVNSRNDGGIRLFSGSSVVAKLEVEEEEALPKKRKAPPQETIDYDERAQSASVSSEWVKDISNTHHWKDNKKPRVLETIAIKKLANGAIECLPVTEP